MRKMLTYNLFVEVFRPCQSPRWLNQKLTKYLFDDNVKLVNVFLSYIRYA